MGKLLKFSGKEGTHGHQFIGQPVSHRMKAALVEPPIKEEASKPFDISLPPELNPSRWDSFKRDAFPRIRKLVGLIFWKDTFREEKVTMPVQIGTHTSMEFYPTDSGGGFMAETAKPVYQDEVISSTRIPIRRLRLPFRLAGAALLISSIGWGAGYCMGFPPPQRLLIESQRQELYRNMDLEECWRTNLSQDSALRDLLIDINRVRCAERKYSEAHRND